MPSEFIVVNSILMCYIYPNYIYPYPFPDHNRTYSEHVIGIPNHLSHEMTPTDIILKEIQLIKKELEEIKQELQKNQQTNYGK